MFGWLVRCVAILCLLCWMGGCGGPKTCKKHHECKVGQRCDDAGVCAKGCGSDLDCTRDGDICAPNERRCAPRPCPRGGKPTALGCICTANTDCLPQHRCVVAKEKETYKYCLPVCEASKPATDPLQRCVCPTAWKLLDGKCQPPCPEGMAREAGGICGPTLATSHEPFWERNTKGELRRRCPDNWERGTNGRCSRKRPEPPAKLPKVGPQKECPPDSNIKWDEGYVARAKLPPSTKVRYVDASAKAGGDGSQATPHHNITKALEAVSDGEVILLAPGTYGWGHVLRNSVHIVGLCPTKVRLEAGPADTNVGFDVKASGVVIEGLSLFGRGYGSVGIDLTEATANGSLRDIYIHGTSAASVSVAGKGMILSRLELQASGTTGLFVVKGTVSMRLENSLLANHKDAGAIVDIGDPTQVADVHFLHNNIEENGRVGVVIGGTFKRIYLEANVLQKNGKSTRGGGVQIAHDKGEVLLFQNLIEANQAVGVHAVRVDVLTMKENMLRDNQHTKTFSAGIWVQSANAVALSDNMLQSFGSTGIRIDHAERIVLATNWIEAATQSDPLGAGIAIQPGFGSAAPQVLPLVQIQDNVLLGTGGVGIFIGGAAKKIELMRNAVSGNSEIALQVGGLRRGFAGAFSLALSHNAFESGSVAAIKVSGAGDTTLKGNLIEGALLGQAGSVGVLIIGGGVVLLEANLFRHLPLAASLQSMKELRLQQNVVFGPEAKVGVFSTGFSVEGVTNDLALHLNLVMGTDRGGLLRLLPESAEVSLTSNVWAKQRHVGLSIRDNSARMTLQGELFLGNGGRHLSVANQAGEVVVIESAFARATAAAAAPQIGWGKSAGAGLYIGSKGLVRWVFSKDKPPCDEDTKGLVVSIDEGWFARPVRVPHALDVCQKWRFDLTSRTDDDRRKASLCDKCYQQNMGCRWVFKTVTGGKTEGVVQRDDWTPDDVVCVAPNKVDSCTNPPKVAYSYLSTPQGPIHAVGQCESHPNDPCVANSACGESRSKTDYCGREKRGIETAPKLASFCRQRSTRGPCHPDRPACPDKLICVTTTRTTLPLSAVPASLSLKRSTFWGNPGPDVVMDQAGRVDLRDNELYLCPKEDILSCPARLVFKRRFNPTVPQVPAWDKAELPKGTTLVWQRPSPFNKIAYQSRLNGDYTKAKGDTPSLLHAPNFCDAYDFY